MFLASLARRNRQPEIIDEPDLDARLHVQALQGLARINRVSASDRILWKPIAALAREQPGRPLRLLDIATGGGDVPIRLWHRARRAGLALEVAGADASATAVDYARDSARRAAASVSFFRLDALGGELPGGFDVLTCSLFLHHLEEDRALDLLRQLGRAANRMVLINDLLRGRLGYLVAWFGTRLLTPSPVVHTDGPRSVEAAFTKAEAVALAARAGLHGATVSWRWPCRFLLTWRRPA
jgi:2-polyprenyl-3-methyl-5-hydroxy-6-metoxy-1,4-benzoquinol methylase